MTNRFSVSNIAWPSDELEPALALLGELGFRGVEIAPRQVFERWDVADGEVEALRERIEAAGLDCPALQGILFDAPDVDLFRSDASRDALALHLDRVAHIAGILGAKSCVFGSPRQRDPGPLPADEALDIAVEFFRSVAPSFYSRDVDLAFEANARAYDCRFVTRTPEAAELVRRVDRPGFAMQIDTGTIFLEREDPAVLAAAAPYAAHAHVSEPDLRPLGSADSDHETIGGHFMAAGYDGTISVEMRATPKWRANIRRAAVLLRRHYA